MEIYLTDTVTGIKKQFPMLPDEIVTEAKTRFQSYDIMSLGEVKLPLGDELTGFSWSGILPGEARKGESYVQAWSSPLEMQGFWSSLRFYGHKAKLMVTDSPINHGVYLESYTAKLSGGVGDYTYTINFIMARDIIVEIEGKEAPKAESATIKATDRGDQAKPKSYTVKKGDSLYKIAEKQLGSGSRYPEIAKLNGLKDPNKIQIGQVLKLP